jgi:hypothetical protein
MSLKRFFDAAVWIVLLALGLLAWVFYDVYQWMWSGV